MLNLGGFTRPDSFEILFSRVRLGSFKQCCSSSEVEPTRSQHLQNQVLRAQHTSRSVLVDADIATACYCYAWLGVLEALVPGTGRQA